MTGWTNLPAERWLAIKEVLEQVFDAPPEERCDLIRQLCGGDADLRREVETLLEAEERAPAFLDGGAAEFSLPLLVDAVREEDVDPAEEVIAAGRYRLVREVGRGGMGTIYVAERSDGLFEHRVAVKLLRPGLDSRHVLARFRAEQQILASLQHPNIARLFDGGVTSSGRPYFVMELVEGSPITTYCDERRLTIPERIRLFLSVCRAVDYAHRNLVVHRDLKPSNILVADDGGVKLLDFGIARLLDQNTPAGDGPYSPPGNRPYSPSGDGPDAPSGDGPYSLSTDGPDAPFGDAPHPPSGNGLYSPSGEEPYSRSGDAPHASSGDAPYSPYVEEPYSLSGEGSETRSGDGPPTRAGFHLMTPEYASPEQVRGETITTASDVYQLGVLLYELLAGVRPHTVAGESLHELERAKSREPMAPSRFSDRLRDRPDADSPTAEVAAVARARGCTPDGLRKMLSGDLDAVVLRAMHPAVERRYHSAAQLADDLHRYLEGRPVTARPDRWSYRASKFVRRNPQLTGIAAACLLLLCASVGLAINHAVTTARLSHEIALERDQAVSESEKVQALADYLTEALESLTPNVTQPRMLPSEEFLERELARVDREFDGQPDLQARLWDVIGRLYQSHGDYDRAHELLSRALEQRRARFEEPHPHIARSLEHLAWLLRVRGEFGEALRHYEAALEQYNAVFEGDHPQKAEVFDAMGTTLITLDEPDAAEELIRSSVEMRDRLYDRDNPARAKGLASLGYLFMQTSRLDEAEPLLSEALAIRHAVYGDTHDEVVVLMQSLGQLLDLKGDDVRAESLYVAALNIRRELYGDSHHKIAHLLEHLGWLRIERGDFAGADSTLLEALTIRRETFGERHLAVGNSLKLLGTLRHRQGRFAEASRLLTQAEGIYLELFGPDHRAVRNTRGELREVQEKLDPDRVHIASDL